MKTLLKFEADWCGPCQQIKPIVAEVLGKHKDDVQLETVNVDDPANMKRVQQFGVRAIPMLVLMDGDTVVRVHRGTLGKSELERFIAA